MCVCAHTHFSFYHRCVTNLRELSNLKQLIYYLMVSMLGAWACLSMVFCISLNQVAIKLSAVAGVPSEAPLREKFTSKFTLLLSRNYFLVVIGQRSPSATRRLLKFLVHLLHCNLLSHGQQGKERLPASLLGVLYNGIEYYRGFCHVLLVRSQS